MLPAVARFDTVRAELDAKFSTIKLLVVALFEIIKSVVEASVPTIKFVDVAVVKVALPPSIFTVVELCNAKSPTPVNRIYGRVPVVSDNAIPSVEVLIV